MVEGDVNLFEQLLADASMLDTAECGEEHARAWENIIRDIRFLEVRTDDMKAELDRFKTSYYRLRMEQYKTNKTEEEKDS